jgi:hypothetical protein
LYEDEGYSTADVYGLRLTYRYLLGTRVYQQSNYSTGTWTKQVANPKKANGQSEGSNLQMGKLIEELQYEYLVQYENERKDRPLYHEAAEYCSLSIP